jgi:hypothetical protein
MGIRGRILRDTSNGVGLVSAAGEQYEFKLEGVWKSDIAPKQNMVVEFELDDSRHIVSIQKIGDADLFKEGANKLIDLVKENGFVAIKNVSFQVDKSTLVAVGMLIVSWFFLDFLNVQISTANRLGMSFWQILGIVNSPSIIDAFQYTHEKEKGLWGVMTILALLSPFVQQIWKNPLAHLGNLLPLALMIAVSASIFFGIKESIEAAKEIGSFFGGNGGDKLASEIMKAMHIGSGIYLSIIVSLYLAFHGTRKYLVSRI